MPEAEMTGWFLSRRMWRVEDLPISIERDSNGIERAMIRISEGDREIDKETPLSRRDMRRVRRSRHRKRFTRQRTALPNLVGMSARDGVAAIDSIGLNYALLVNDPLRSVRYETANVSAPILRTAPPAGSTLRRSTIVILFVDGSGDS